MRLLGGVLRSGEPGDRDLTLRRDRFAMRPDAMQLVEGRGREVAAPAVQATNNRNLLNHQKVPTLTVAPRNPVDVGSLGPAEIANYGSGLSHDTR